MPKASRKNVHNLFTGYQVEEIMRVCAVSRATAQHFKRGSRAPSPQATRLWWLHIQGRILGSEWQFLRVLQGVLVDEAGNSYAEGEIRTLPYLHQQVSELKRQLRMSATASGMTKVEIEGIRAAVDAMGAAMDRIRGNLPPRDGDAEVQSKRKQPTFTSSRASR